ncbi:hypothetical protein METBISCDRAFT_11859 [Metschnikowia bicuspidata]|uniref:histidine kinase n=1 Tax=Metschnikowia bicuspidata TaxID=27322 RepID=A0A4V1J3M3_9ASCO|nr:hypothetical protein METBISCDRAFT_11859 [Metschnikowia bicuspidata]
MKRRLKVGIRPQLIIIVCFSSLSSLLILAVVTGIYFSRNFSALRGDRLMVIAELKAIQVKQSIQFIYFQVLALLQKDSISNPLSYYRAGNQSQDMGAAQTTLDEFVSSLETFVLVQLYDLNLSIVASSENNNFNISSSLKETLYPLLPNSTIPLAVISTNLSNAVGNGYMSGPLRNSTNINSIYFLGITLPIYSNSSIIINRPAISGYLTMLASAETVQNALATVSNVDYDSLAFKAIYQNSSVTGNSDYIVGFESILPNINSPLLPNVLHLVNSSASATIVLHSELGMAKNVRQVDKPDLAIGFYRIGIDTSSSWSIVIQQKRSTFLAPIKKLRDIMIGVVIGTGIFMCLFTFGLAVWFINPITKLKEATEAITRLKRAKDFHSIKNAKNLLRSSTADLTDSKKRDSVGTISSSGSNGRSTGIRLPGKIPESNKLFKDELTELSEAFNIMTEELEKQYAHLEDRVRQRTKELEASKIEAEAANEAKTVFIANISHDLRTPLNGILGMTSIAMEETDQLQIQDSLRLIHRSGELLMHIFTELLTYSKYMLNRSKLEKSNFQILEVANQVKSIFGKEAIDQRVNFDVFIKPNILRKLILFGDSNRIIQIVMNLVSNSLKFTPVDGSVDVKFKLVGKYDYEASKATDFTEVCLLKHTKSKSLSLDSSDTTKADQETKHAPLAGVIRKEVAGACSNGDSASLTGGDAERAATLSASMYSNKSTDLCFNSSDSCSLTTISTTEYEDTLFRSQFVPTNEIFRNNKVYRLRKLYHPQTWVIQIEVKDTGSGIEPAVQEKVFEPFVQGDQTLSRSHGGTGLGLSICRQLAKMMHGTLSLRSTIGIGSLFIFTVPLPQSGEIVVPDTDIEEFCNDEFNIDSKVNREVLFYIKDDNDDKSDVVELKESLKPQPVKLKSYSTIRSTSTGAVNQKTGDNCLKNLSHLSILVAEDNLVNQEVIKRMLRLEGFSNITMAANGVEAVDLVQQSYDTLYFYDIIFMDVQMPKMDGLTATKIIRNNLQFKKPIVALTAFADESNVKECLNCGMSGFLSKPIKRTNLRMIVTEFSPALLSGTVTTPNTFSEEEKRVEFS